MSSEPRKASDSAKAFAALALEMGLLDDEAHVQLLARQEHYRNCGIPMRPEQIVIELGLMTAPQVTRVVTEFKARREKTRASAASAAENPRPDDLPLPFKLGPFLLQRRLGGALGSVYLALDEDQGQAVALKLLPANMLHDRELVERFKREAQLMRTLEHPNLVRCLGAGCTQGRFYIAMAYVDGESLEAVLDRTGKLGEAPALVVAHELVSALAYLHAQELVHRDIKPSNVILGRDGRARLADLGLAKFTSRQSDLTAEGMTVGTPHYIAPEQAVGAKQLDARADLYSMGALLFHLLCGRPPYEAEEALAVMRMHVYDPVPDPHRINPKLSIASRTLLMKLLQKDPNRRVQNAAELERILRGLIESDRRRATV